MKRSIQPLNAAKPQFPFSLGVLSDGLLFVSGQAPVNLVTNEIEYGDIRSETRRALSNIQTILEAGGCSLKDVVRVGVFLNDLKDVQPMNEVYREFFSENQPARTTVGVQLPKFKVEIDCIARVPVQRHRRKQE
ncbi:MAG TPA: RidA family protein [Terriglobales bacterium]|nr:RidA family protein [Terriglobales bacterium]